MLGHWKNFEELEDNLCLEELQAILEAARDRELRQQKFAAALKGIQLPDNQKENSTQKTFDEVVAEAKAEAMGKTTEEVQFREEQLGFGFEIEEEE